VSDKLQHGPIKPEPNPPPLSVAGATTAPGSNAAGARTSTTGSYNWSAETGTVHRPDFMMLTSSDNARG
jgi:hypothetical protein